MSDQTDLIPLSYLNEACLLSINTNDKKYRMCLKMSQEQLRDQVLGLTYYNEIISQFSANTLTSDNDTLYENYIKDYLAWQTYYNYLKFANVISTPTGIRVHKEDNSDIASDVQMYSLEKNVLQWVDNYRYGIFNCINLARASDTTKYPLWDSSRCGGGGLSFAITAVDKNVRRANVISVNNSIRANE